MRLEATVALCSLALATAVVAAGAVPVTIAGGTAVTTSIKPGSAQRSSTSFAAVQDAAERGDRDAMFRLGRMYASGRGVAEDDTRAAEWYRKAADGGDSRAMVHLAAMHTAGEGVRRDEDDARRWYQKAAEQGNTRAMTALGARCASGVGTARDDAAERRELAVSVAEHNNLGLRIRIRLELAARDDAGSRHRPVPPKRLSSRSAPRGRPSCRGGRGSPHRAAHARFGPCSPRQPSRRSRSPLRSARTRAPRACSRRSSCP